jgi:hypothetical protein
VRSLFGEKLDAKGGKRKKAETMMLLLLLAEKPHQDKSAEGSKGRIQKQRKNACT